MVCDLELLAPYAVQFILKDWHFTVQLALPPECGAARPLALPFLLFPCQMELVFLSGTHSAEGLGKGIKTEEQTSQFFHFAEVALSKG